jgi:hypothetical protein
MPAERMAATIAGLMAREATMTPEEDYVRLLHEAGFTSVASFFRVMSGAISAWIAR